jgi:hypothetical protein
LFRLAADVSQQPQNRSARILDNVLCLLTLNLEEDGTNALKKNESVHYFSSASKTKKFYPFQKLVTTTNM